MTQHVAASARKAVAIVIGTPFTQSDAIYVSTGGDLVLTMADGVNATFVGVPDGAILSVACTNVVSGGGDHVALYYV